MKVVCLQLGLCEGVHLGGGLGLVVLGKRELLKACEAGRGVGEPVHELRGRGDLCRENAMRGVSRASRSELRGTHDLWTGAHRARGGGPEAEDVELPSESHILLLCSAGALLKVSDILGFSRTIVPLLKQGSRRRDGEIFPSSAGHDAG